MVLVDTCGWIEWLTDGPLADAFGPHLEQTDALLVPTLVQYELAKWITRERDETLALEVIGLTHQSRVVALDTSLALGAAALALEHRLAMADAVIYATARAHDATVVTSDAHFEHLSGVTYLRQQTKPD
jgi:predicted nucleic acid-binding protein